MGNETSNIQNSNGIQLTAEIGLTNNTIQGKEGRLLGVTLPGCGLRFVNIFRPVTLQNLQPHVRGDRLSERDPRSCQDGTEIQISKNASV